MCQLQRHRTNSMLFRQLAAPRGMTPSLSSGRRTVPQVPDVLRKELAGVCKACFSTNPAHRHAHVVAQYRKQFVNELNPEAAAFPSTLGELSGALALHKPSTGLTRHCWFCFPEADLHSH